MTISLENTATVGYLQQHAVEIVGSLAESGEPLVITVDGQSKAVLVDFEKYEKLELIRRGIQLKKILDDRYDHAERDGTFVPVDEAFQRIKEKIMARKPS